MKKHLWILILPLAFLVYSTGFSGYPQIRENGKALGQEDSANFIILIENFSLANKYGDEYRTRNRNLYDTSQKHKLHHALYVIAASGLYKSFAAVYRVFGISSNQALFSINAFITCISLVLLYILVRHFDPVGSGVGWYVLFYAVALSTWVYASTPGSWNFVPMLILLFLLLFYKYRINRYVLAAIAGVFMLSNVMLVSLLALIVLELVAEDRAPRAVIPKSTACFLIAMAAWAAGLTVFSFYDESFRPDRLLAYTFWFREFLDYRYKMSLVKVIATNLFINSIVSNQSNPSVPPEALLLTLKQSVVGTIATIAYLVMAGTVAVRLARDFARTSRGRGGVFELLKREEAQLAAYVLVWVFLTGYLYPPGAFLYAVTIVPLLVLIGARYIDFDRPFDRYLLCGTVCAVALNNIAQILKFREVLAHGMR